MAVNLNFMSVIAAVDRVPLRHKPVVVATGNHLRVKFATACFVLLLPILDMLRIASIPVGAGGML